MRLTITQGDTAKLSIPVLAADGSALDLSLFSEIKFSIKRSAQDSDAAAVFIGTFTGGEVTVNDTNIALVRVSPEATALIRFGRTYFWELEISDDLDTYTPCSGDILAENQLSNG